MAKKSPWHSDKLESEVYHNNSDCNTGNNIERENYDRGTGGKERVCAECKQWNKKE